MGIGKTDPGQALDVVGNARVSGTFIAGNTTTYGDGSITLSSGTNLNIDSNTLFVDNANNRVGVGTATPFEELDVSAVANPGISLTDGTSGTQWSLYTIGSDPSRLGFFEIQKTSGTDTIPFTIEPGAPSYTMYLDGTGRVGVGTASPVADLHVGAQEAAANSAGTVARLAIQPYGHTGGPWVFDARDTSGNAFLDLRYGTASNALTVRFDASAQSSRVGIGTQSPGVLLGVCPIFPVGVSPTEE